MQAEPLAHYRPWLEDLRKDKPHQLDDKLEQLFHEKSVTGRAAWNRLFDETIASLRFAVRGEELAIEPTLNKLQDSDRKSTRLNSSHANISYAVFCLKKKKKITLSNSIQDHKIYY